LVYAKNWRGFSGTAGKNKANPERKKTFAASTKKKARVLSLKTEERGRLHGGGKKLVWRGEGVGKNL